MFTLVSDVIHGRLLHKGSWSCDFTYAIDPNAARTVVDLKVSLNSETNIICAP